MSAINGADGTIRAHQWICGPLRDSAARSAAPRLASCLCRSFCGSVPRSMPPPLVRWLRLSFFASTAPSVAPPLALSFRHSLSYPQRPSNSPPPAFPIAHPHVQLVRFVPAVHNPRRHATPSVSPPLTQALTTSDDIITRKAAMKRNELIAPTCYWRLSLEFPLAAIKAS